MRLHLLFLFLGIQMFVSAQFLNGLGVQVNFGKDNRLNAAFCFETRLIDNFFLRVNAGYGNLIPFNTSSGTGRLFLMRRTLEPENNAQHLNLIYRGFDFVSQESTFSAPEMKVGVIYMLNKFRKKNRLLSGLYLGYQTSFSKIVQPYTNYYQNDSLNQKESLSGVNKYYSWSWVNLLGGYKWVISNRATLDIGIEQTLGILFDHRFKRISEYYKNPYSGLKVDVSVGFRYLF